MTARHQSNSKRKKKKKNTHQQDGGRDDHQQSSSLTVQQQLRQIGAYVYEVSADGNCLFRSLHDQLECLEDAGGVKDHVDLRRKIVQEIRDNKEFFSCFIEDDETFEEYIERMSEEEAWGGNIEIQAFCTLFHVNVRIYQSFQASWTVMNFPEEGAAMLHISYHDGNHYNSVRDAASGKPLSCCRGGGHQETELPQHTVAMSTKSSDINREKGNSSIRVIIRVRDDDGFCDVSIDTTDASTRLGSPKKKNLCPCGSNKKYKKCCKKREKRMNQLKVMSEPKEESLAKQFTTNIYV